MNQQEFMRKNLVNAMVSSGHKQAIAEQLADEGGQILARNGKV